jgi:hypothetical protein
MRLGGAVGGASTDATWHYLASATAPWVGCHLAPVSEQLLGELYGDARFVGGLWFRLLLNHTGAVHLDTVSTIFWGRANAYIPTAFSITPAMRRTRT